MSAKSLLSLVFAGALVTACATVAPSAGGLHDVEPQHSWSNVDRAYSDMDARYVRNGVSRTLDRVRQLAVGQSRAAVDAILGKPEALDGDLVFYTVNLPHSGRDEMVCQYVARFADGALVDGGWRRAQCAGLVG